MTLFSLLAWLPFEDNPLVSVLQGLVGACGISLTCNLLRIYLFIQRSRNSPAGGTSEKANGDAKSVSRLSSGIQFVLLTGVLCLVGQRLACLIVLEFCLRAVLASLLFGPGNTHEVNQFLIQCQFSLGCALTCCLRFLHGEAPHRGLSVLLAAGLSWFLSRLGWRLWAHVQQFYPQHSSQHDCGVCMTLVSSGEGLLPTLRHSVVIAFGVGGVAATAVMDVHFQLFGDLKFWTPMTMCYVLVLLRILEDQQSNPSGEALLRSAVLRVGALLSLLLMVGTYTDLLQVPFFLFGEALCLLPSVGLLRSTAPQGENKYPAGRTFSVRQEQTAFPDNKRKND